MLASNINRLTGILTCQKDNSTCIRTSPVVVDVVMLHLSLICFCCFVALVTVLNRHAQEKHIWRYTFQCEIPDTVLLQRDADVASTTWEHSSRRSLHNRGRSCPSTSMALRSTRIYASRSSQRHLRTSEIPINDLNLVLNRKQTHSIKGSEVSWHL